MKPGPVRSDLRVCASREPKSEPEEPWSQTRSTVFSKSMNPETFFQKLSHRASENKGLRPRRDLKRCRNPPGYTDPMPERHFVPEFRRKMEKRTAEWQWCKNQCLKAMGCRYRSKDPEMQPAGITVTCRRLRLRLQKVNGNYSNE